MHQWGKTSRRFDREPRHDVAIYDAYKDIWDMIHKVLEMSQVKLRRSTLEVLYTHTQCAYTHRSLYPCRPIRIYTCVYVQIHTGKGRGLLRMTEGTMD